MVSAELTNRIKELSRADKLEILEVLISEMTQEETDLIQPGQSYPIWSPYNALAAAKTMLEVLQNSEHTVADSVQCASSNWLENVIGSVSDEQTFLEALEYGKSLRYADRPTEETKE